MFFLTQSALLNISVGAAVALVLMEILSFFCGILGINSFGIRVFVALGLPIVGLFGLSRKYLSHQIKGYFRTKIDPGQAVFGELLFIIICLGFLSAFVPETLLDAAALHIPKAETLATSASVDAFTKFPYQPFTLLSPYIHIIFQIPLSFGGHLSLKALTWVLAILITFSIIGICRIMSVLGYRALAAAFFFVSMPIYIWHFGTGYIDLTSAYFSVTGVLALLLIEETKGNDILYGMICGLLFGASITSKLTMIPFVLSFLFCWLVVGSIGRTWTQKIKNKKKAILLIATGMLVISVPHWVYQYHITGNPIYPAFSKYFASPYWNAAVNPEAVQKFGNIPWWGWLVWPYSVVMHTSWFGSIVENVDGSTGYWFLLFFPLAIKGMWSMRNVHTVRIVGAGSFLYVTVMALLGSAYMRYYIQVIPVLFCLMAAGSPRKEENSKKIIITWPIIGVIVGFITIVQFAFPTVWSPSLAHWQNYRHGSTGEWLENIYPGFSELKLFLSSLPRTSKVIAFNTDYVCHLPFTAHYLRPADIVFSGGAGFDSASAIELGLNSDLWGFLGRFRRGEMPQLYDFATLDKILSENGDILLVSSSDDLDFLSKSRFTEKERLLFSARRPGGTLPRTMLVFAINDDLLPTKVITTHEYISGNVNNNQWSSNIELGTSINQLLASLHWRLPNLREVYPQVSALWEDESGKTIESHFLRIVYAEGKADAFLLTEPPKAARVLRLTSSIKPTSSALLMRKENGND